MPPQPDRHHWVRTAAQNCSNITRLAIFPQISKYFSKYSNTTRLAIFFQGRILHEGRGTGLPKCFTYQQCRPGAFTSVYSFKIKILVKLDSVSPPPRMATSTLSLQSRRTTSRRTRLLPGVSKKFLLHKIFPARSPGKRTLRCWSRTRRTSSMWWRAATRGSPPPSRWRSSTISDAIPRWRAWGQMKGLDYSS